LEQSGWRWLRSEHINWRVLYNASVPLTRTLSRDIIELSSIDSGNSDLGKGGE